MAMKHVARFSIAAELLGKGTLVSFFAILATLKIGSIKARFVAWEQTDGSEKYLGVMADFASLVFMVLLIVLAATRLRPSQTAAGWEPRISALAGSFLSFALVALPPADLGPTWQATGVALIAISAVLSAYVLMRLGRSFSVIPQARRLVTTGPYAIVRHPLYLCEEIAVIGVAMIHFSYAAIVIVIVQWIFQLRRMVNEERVLSARFREYNNYAAHTPRVLPWPRRMHWFPITPRDPLRPRPSEAAPRPSIGVR